MYARVASSVAGVIEPALQAAETARSATRPTDDLTIRNEQTGAVRKCASVPKELIDLMCGGGIFPLLESQGLIAPLPAKKQSNQAATA